MSNLPKANRLISEQCWEYWNQKRLENNNQRPPMPKNLPQTLKIIYDPPWIWDEVNKKYIQNVMGWSRALICKSKNEFPTPYDPNNEYKE